METDRVVVEALEPRQFLSGTGPLVHHHLIPRFHHGTTVRLWRFPSCSIAPDVLIGQYTGTSKETFDPNDERGNSVTLTLSKSPTGEIRGVLHLIDFVFDDITAYVNPGAAILVSGRGGTQMIYMDGVVSGRRAHRTTWTGTYLSWHAAGLFQGTFSLTKIS